MAAKPHGAIGVDFTYDVDGAARITEVQPARFYSSIFFLARLGLNLPDLYCRLGVGVRIPAEERLINPIREEYVWLKSVDRLPTLLRGEDYWQPDSTTSPSNS